MRILLLFTLLVSSLAAEPVKLFDGESLAGWEVRKGEEKWWRVEDGCIVGGSLKEAIPHNTFLATKASYENFDLRLKIRLVEGEGFMNSGIQIRSRRMDDNHEMIGYQVDAGPGFWGDLYDESRRNRAVAKAADPEALAATVKPWEWNDFRVLCEGRRIRSWIDGVPTFDYIEEDGQIPRDGKIGIQAHGGGQVLVQVKDIVLTELPPSIGAPTWEKPGVDEPRTPQAQAAGFHLPEGFSAELVASEVQGVPKPISLAWDRHGRMWTMTAIEYPVDANENEAAARAMFERGGKDRVLVFDEPNAVGPQVPRVFADGLAIPLGVLPFKGDALVQYGSEIRRYVDLNGDGTAEDHAVILEGFGIQDSHLFPHQFERAPGGWVYLAQGLFNDSQVRRPTHQPFANGETSVRFAHCKLARFKPDGSAFELLTGGPNNIWGFTISRHGEVFIQEANDLGYPVAEFAPGTHYPSGSRDKLREDAPVLPPSTPGQPMGGTGLSGLAMADDLDSPFAAGLEGQEAQVFYIANPITSRIQTVEMTRSKNGHPSYRKGRDFMLSDDPWFRPIAIYFGPDGCLYLVDWYNKIISHNEVPRTHPERDKSRGRIWRIRHESQPPAPRIDFAALVADDLIALLDAASSRVARMAWHELVDRNAQDAVAPLTARLMQQDLPLAGRLGALWALEGLGKCSPELLMNLSQQQPEPELRYELARIAGEEGLDEVAFLAVTSDMAEDPHYRVRSAVVNAVRDHPAATPKMIAHIAHLAKAPMEDTTRAAYDRQFERYLVRWVMSLHPHATRQALEQEELSLEAKLLATRSFEEGEAASRLLKLLSELERPLIADELSLLGKQIEQAEVITAFDEMLADPTGRLTVLRTLLQLEGAGISPELAAVLSDAASDLLQSQPSNEVRRLVAELARKFRLPQLAGEIRTWTQRADISPEDLALGLAALRESGQATVDDFLKWKDHSADAVKRAAVSGLASIDAAEVVEHFATMWPTLPGALRAVAMDGMTATATKAQALATALGEDAFPGFDGNVIDRVVQVLGEDHAAVKAALAKHQALLKRVLRLDGSDHARIKTDLTLTGPFTIEGWIKLASGIGNSDSLFGRQGGVDLNFYDGRLRLYGGPGLGDQIAASTPAVAGHWMHCALTRDSDGELRLYLDGQPDPAEGRQFSEPLVGLNLGESNAPGGTEALFDEVRIWEVARTAEEISRDHRTRFTGSPPPGLLHRITAEHPGGGLDHGAHIALTLDLVDLVTPDQARQQEERFARFREMASAPGNVARGKALAQASCLICHQVAGEGMAIGPDLSGAGAMGQEALLRNLLTPNAQLESGYYRHDVRLTDGSVVSGFLAEKTENSLTIRQIAAAERIIPLAQVASHEVSRRSLMPEGLLEGFAAEQVADLFAYLMSLK